VTWFGRGRQRGTAAVQARNYYFFLFFFLSFLLFLSFLPFLAIRITPLPDPLGQRNVDQTSTYH
jgi:hypothetical protein